MLGISILFFWVRGWGKGAEGKRSMLTPRYRRSSSHKSQKAAALPPRRGPRRTRERRYTGTTVVPASSQSQRTGRAQEARLGNQRVTCGRGVSLIGFGRNQLISSAVPIGHTHWVRTFWREAVKPKASPWKKGMLDFTKNSYYHIES